MKKISDRIRGFPRGFAIVYGEEVLSMGLEPRHASAAGKPVGLEKKRAPFRTAMIRQAFEVAGRSGETYPPLACKTK